MGTRMSTSCEGKGQRLRSEETMNALLFFLNPNSIQPKTKENEGFYTPAAYLDRLQCGKCLKVFHKRYVLKNCAKNNLFSPSSLSSATLIHSAYLLLTKVLMVSEYCLKQFILWEIALC